MPIWDTQELDFDVDAVLRGQGAEPGLSGNAAQDWLTSQNVH